MKARFKELRISTKERVQIVDVTRDVEAFVSESGIKNGLCLVYAPHATVAIVVNEHEAGLVQDILKKVKDDFPRGVGWRHDLIDDNANAHLASSFISSSRIFPVKDGSLIRGVWQNIFLLEMDGPRPSRKLLVEVIGE